VDAWFIGFIPQLTTSVWVGYPDERRPMVNLNGLTEINGENYPLDIWSLYMQSAVSMFPEQEFDVPSPYMDLQVKTDGHAVPPLEETTVESTDETTESTDAGEPNPEDESSFDEPAGSQPGQQQGLEPAAPQSASPAPQSASPAPMSAPPRAQQPAPREPRREVPARRF
jgi:penicillin-binding protein 1A